MNNAKVGKLSFKAHKKSADPNRLLTSRLSNALLQKRRHQDGKPINEHQNAEETVDVREVASKNREEHLDPEQIVKKIKIGKTQAQVSYDMIKMKRIEEKIEKQLELTYREKIEEFNRKISKLPEHYDIPKVSG